MNGLYLLLDTMNNVIKNNKNNFILCITFFDLFIIIKKKLTYNIVRTIVSLATF